MAFGDPPSGPDFGAMLSLIKASQGQGGSGCAPILLGVRLECNVGAPLSIQGRGLNYDSMICKSAQARPGLLAKLLKDAGFDRGEIAEGIKKCADAAHPQQAVFREASQAELFGQGGSGGGFVQGLGMSPRGGGIEMA